MKTGGVRSAVQVTVLVTVAVLPQASVAVKVLTCDCKQPLVLTLPLLEVIVTVPQPSVAVAEPSAAVISDAEGLHPKTTSV